MNHTTTTRTRTRSTAAIGALILALTAAAMPACGEDEGGEKGFSCPRAGDKDCPNDVAYTQADERACKQCESVLRAQYACQGPPTCGSDGKKEPPKSTCTAEAQKVIACYVGGGSDGGASDGGGTKDAAPE